METEVSFLNQHSITIHQVDLALMKSFASSTIKEITNKCTIKIFAQTQNL